MPILRPVGGQGYYNVRRIYVMLLRLLIFGWGGRWGV